MGIANCRHKGLEELYVSGKTSRIGKLHHKTILFILDFLAATHDIDDCEGVKKFHELKGKLKGTCSMTVSANYRLTFKWNGEDVYDLNFEDYH